MAAYTAGYDSPRSRPQTAILRVIIVLNVLVFILWLLAGPSGGAERLRFMQGNFLVGRAYLEQGRFWTLLTAAFSHRGLWHLLLNMMVLHSFGSVMVRRWGQRTFLFFYLAAAVVSSLGHVAVGWLIARDDPALGASGAVSATLAAFAFFYPRQRLLVLGFVPLPAFVAVLLFVAFDVWGVVAQSAGSGLPIGHGAHLGGAAFGLAYSLFQRRRRPPEPGPDLASLEALLHKLRAGGIESLNADERSFLEALRGRADRS